MAHHWTAELVNEALMASGLGSLDVSTNRGVQVIRDLLAERDELEQIIAEHARACARAAESSYRLPDWLGGLPVIEVKADAATPDYVEATYDPPAEVTGGEVFSTYIRRDLLVEIKPPSIDEPASWPLTLNDSGGRWISLADMGGELTTIRVGYRDRDWGIDLSPSDLRWIARAAWQRAAAVDGA